MTYKVSCKWVVSSLRIIGMVFFVGMLLYNSFDSYCKLRDRKMTFISTTATEPNITYPTITICITMDNDFNGGPMSQDWMNDTAYNFTFPISDFGVVSEQKRVEIG